MGLGAGDKSGCRECQKCHVIFAPASTTVVAVGRRLLASGAHPKVSRLGEGVMGKVSRGQAAWTSDDAARGSVGR